MSDKKNIALFVSSIGYGGTERVVHRFTNELIKYYNVTLVVIYGNIELPVHENVNIVCLTNRTEHFKVSFFSITVDYIKSLFKYPTVLKQNEIDVSISFLIRQNVINGVAKIFNPNLKTIISERCYPSKTYGTFGKVLVNMFYNKNDILFSNSLHINSDLKTNFNIKIPAHLIYNPIYTLKEKPHFMPYDMQKDIFKIISVGRLNPVKNQKSLIKSMGLLDDKSNLNLFGVGELEGELKQLTASLNLKNRVHFKGNHNDINSMTLQHHCLILTSLSEGFPNVILEAMSMGVPVISTNCKSGPLELLNDNIEIEIEQNSFYQAKYGLLVNVNDELGLTKAILFYQNNEDIRKKYSSLSFNKAKLYDISTIGLQLKDLIDSNLCVE